MMGLAVMLDDLQISLREVDVLATLTVAAYDKANWTDPDPGVVESIASLLGLIKKSAATAIVPPLAQRSAELDRIIAEYASDAITELAAPTSSFTADDHAWVRDNAAASLAEIEKAKLRLVTLHTSTNLSHAAKRLGMAPVLLHKWLARRRSPPMRSSGRRSHP